MCGGDRLTKIYVNENNFIAYISHLFSKIVMFQTFYEILFIQNKFPYRNFDLIERLEPSVEF